MRPGVRSLLIYAIALVLPLILFVALQAAFSMRALRGQIEADTLGRTREINAAVDGQLLANQSALEVLATSQFIISHDWKGAEARVGAVQRARWAWKNVILTDLASGREIWETARTSPLGPPARPWIARYVASHANLAVFTGVVGKPPECPCVSVQAPINEGGTPRYLLTLELSPQVFQQILLQHAPPRSTSAIVDREGLFVARTIAYPTKLGTPATRFVREAIRRERQGLYPGVTYEGLKNYTAFETSDLTGWSTHVAVKSSLLSGPRLGSILLTGVAALAALVLALGIVGYGYRQAHLRRLEEARSAQSQKLAAVGQLATGLAHDFNNLLMIIGNSLQRISLKNQDPALRRSIDNAVEASERGAMLIRQLMAFTRSQPLDIDTVDLAALLEGLRGMLQESVGNAVALTIDISPEARWVSTNGPQLEMALLNLAVNARDAMPGGGALTIRTGKSKSQPDCVDLDVIDTGEGMPREVIDRAMEPFFTTKPLGKGTGLGLAQVFGVVSQSGGSVEIRSEVGVGATITLRLKARPPI